MSRSRKKPYVAITGSESSKSDKIVMHKKFRRINKILVKLGLDHLFDKMKEVSDNWDWKRDGGKHYYGGSEYEDKASRK